MAAGCARLTPTSSISFRGCLNALFLGAGLLYGLTSVEAHAEALDPEAAVQMAAKFRAQNQPVISRLLASPADVAAVRKALEASPDPRPVVLDVDARIGSPSLSLMLLDELARVPAGWEKPDVLLLVRARLNSPRSEERIVALRNLARLAPEERPAVQRALREILRRPAAAGGRNSFAVAQALDGVAALADVEAIPLLEGWLDDPVAAPLAGMTLDRLAAAAPLATAAFLNANPKLLDAFPLLRADYFAKGSLRSAAGRAEIGRYLLRKDVSAEERTKFFASYLQRGTFLVSGIFTGPSRPEVREGNPQADVEWALERWKDDPAMNAVCASAREALSPAAEENPIPR